MKVLIVGNKGNMGRRYSAILKSLSVDFIGIDKGDIFPKDYDTAIICTPVDTHYEICKQVILDGKDFLCEKPISKNLNEIANLIILAKENNVNGFMVCNWKFVLFPLVFDKYCNVVYDYYNYGENYWDLIQPLYLSKELKVSDCPYFNVTINNMVVTQHDFDMSYLTMLLLFKQSKYSELWTLEDAYKATEKVIEYARNNPSA